MKKWNLRLIGLAKKIQYTGGRYPQRRKPKKQSTANAKSL